MTGQPINFNAWERATEALPWGVQHALYDTLALASEGAVKIVHGANVHDGRPCLINAISAMLTSTGNQSMPQQFDDLVGAFDSLNARFEVAGINTKPHFVSELGAEILLQHFAPLKAVEAPEPVKEPDPVDAPYVERSDDEMLAAMEELSKAYVPYEQRSTEDKTSTLVRVIQATSV
jgi:hypothetical protein